MTCYPGRALDALTPFFKNWAIDPAATPGLTLELGRETGKNAQAICLMLQVPEEVYVLHAPGRRVGRSGDAVA